MRRGAAYLAGRGGRGHQPRAQRHCVVDNVKCFTLELLHWRAIHLKWNAIKHLSLRRIPWFRLISALFTDFGNRRWFHKWDSPVCDGPPRCHESTLCARLYSACHGAGRTWGSQARALIAGSLTEPDLRLLFPWNWAHHLSAARGESRHNNVTNNEKLDLSYTY